jgi:hypothetical protein
VTPLDLDEIGRSHKNAMLNTATGRALALACSEIQQLRAEVERLREADAALARVWQALGITQYTGNAVWEEVERLRAENTATWKSWCERTGNAAAWEALCEAANSEGGGT